MHLENTTPFNSALTVAFEPSGRELVVVVCKATFDISREGGPCQEAEVQRALLFGDETGPDPALSAPVMENDFAPHKPACDVMSVGRAFAPGGRPVSEINASLRVGPMSKAFRVHGERIWLKGMEGHFISDSRPFLSQEIGYDHAWGGVDPHRVHKDRFATCEANPAGRGYYPNRDDLSGLPLPNTEALDQRVKRSDGDYRPMALGPIGRTWLPRRNFAGTYDERWQRERMPFPPTDLDSRYFQAAPPDQQIPYPRGGEPFRLVNLSPHGDLEGQLPAVDILMRFERKSGRFTQKIANLDTVVFLPEEDQLCLTWRAHLRPDRDMFDLGKIVVFRR
jgi:hypothetical protein